MVTKRVVSPETYDAIEDQLNLNLRPTSFREYVGQPEAIEKIKIAVQAAQEREEPLEHMLFYGPPGLGKTTLAHILAREMKTKIIISSGPSLTRPGDLVGILTGMQQGDILFVDEIHRLSSTVEEFMYPAMEDFRVDFIAEKGIMARTINIPLKPFTLVGATTRAGSITSPLRNRFGLFYMVDFYPAEDLAEIIRRSAGLLQVQIHDDAIMETARRSRGTPRIANRLLRRVRDYSQVKGDGVITMERACQSLEIEGIDSLGLDVLDRKYLSVIVKHYHGGPVGIEAIAATLNEDVMTLEDMVEPYLLKVGFLKRTKQGRCVGPDAYRHLDITPLPTNQAQLFE